MAQLLLSVIVDYFSIMKNSSAFVLFTLKMTCFFIIRLAIKKAMCCHLCLVQIVVQIGRDQKNGNGTESMGTSQCCTPVSRLNRSPRLI